MISTGFCAIQILPTDLTTFMSTTGWFVGTLYAGVVSSAVANVLNLFKESEWFTVMNISVVLVALALCRESELGQFVCHSPGKDAAPN